MNFSCHTHTIDEAIDRVKQSDLDEDDKAAMIRVIHELQPIPVGASIVASAYVSRQLSNIAIRFEARTSAPLA